ncbi:protein arginine N-methyltransferase 5-like [Sycon ciliatum]|uniref:protein arginine N-methyltransferase 5-like n=1 Tax=Sycon ciliatum TaxID=27933 RepID=UPI0020ADE7CC|eukprot:scpid46035/ scgid15118/ Protein arginine N-methyltransferase 5; Histone-arginine N-methyltransferase PRMT5; Shk1 kinase-binding protein 1 homolog
MAHSPRKAISVGRDMHAVPDLNCAVTDAASIGFDFIVAPIFHPRFQRSSAAGADYPYALTRSDFVLPSNEWSRIVVGRISPWIDVDSPCEHLRKRSEKALVQEINYAIHLCQPTVLITLRSVNCANLARVINSFLVKNSQIQFWIQTPLIHPRAFVENLVDGDSASHYQPPASRDDDPWHWWNTLRMLCSNSTKLGLVPEIQSGLPDQDILSRLCGEPVVAAVLPTSTFMNNNKGFPVLSQLHQSLIQRLLKLDIQPILSGSPKHERGVKVYLQYINHLHQSLPPPGPVEAFSRGYEDYLQSPLQPLHDNLESQTYEVFEKDPIKYKQYQEAVYRALLDRVSEEEKDTKVTTVMVVGAGRGPLVRQSLEAANRAQRLVKVYAVEKNPNAVVTLRTFKEEEWHDRVTVVSCDMREWKAPVKADILVSELLGSFSDNELSPECLDGAQSFLKDDGISIPSEYTSYLAPLSAPRLHAQVANIRDPNSKDRTIAREDPYESGYVVRLHNVSVLSQAQAVFNFTHPNRPQPGAAIDNERYVTLRFVSSTDGLMHGFAGYFDTALYKDVMLSILPETHSPGMFSWFPMFFPLKEPIAIRKGEVIEACMWRKANSKDVWYEWCLTRPVPTPLQNALGQTYHIGL